MDDGIREKLIEKLGELRVKFGEPMKNHTSFRIGGPADAFYEAKTAGDLQKAIKACSEADVPFFILGVGANILVSDKGIRGLVIKMSNNGMEVVGPLNAPAAIPKVEQTHYKSFDTKRYLRFDDLDSEEPPPDTIVRAGAGVSLPMLITWTLGRGLTGLQNFSGIPSSVGGAVYNNIHGGTKLFDRFVKSVVLLNRRGITTEVSRGEMGFSYDRSRIQMTGEIVVEVFLALSHGDAKKAEWVRQEWLKRKLKVQPQKNCPGCIFKNVTPEEAVRIGVPTVAAGWILDIGLGMKGVKVGGVEISAQHANFFVNNGNGSSSDAFELIKICKEKAKTKFNLDLTEEIQLVGEF